MYNPKKVRIGCAKKVSDKIQHSFMIKIFNKLGIEGNFLNLTQDIHEKSTTNIRLNGERSKFPLRSGTK